MRDVLIPVVQIRTTNDFNQPMFFFQWRIPHDVWPIGWVAWGLVGCFGLGLRLGLALGLGLSCGLGWGRGLDLDSCGSVWSGFDWVVRYLPYLGLLGWLKVIPTLYISQTWNITRCITNSETGFVRSELNLNPIRHAAERNATSSKAHGIMRVHPGQL